METLRALVGSQWVGRNELWLDPLGDVVNACDARLRVEEGAIHYTWSHEGKAHEGRLVLREGGADFVDTFHAATGMPLVTNPGGRALVDLSGTYYETWGWRITLSQRPNDDSTEVPGALVLQMTNITPWGEEVRAVRMITLRRIACSKRSVFVALDSTVALWNSKARAATSFCSRRHGTA